MATISTDTYLDGGTSRTAGEAWTINSGAKFTIRSDTRWHENAPASMTGSLGAITCNEGEVIFDGRSVRWLPFDTGSSTVPSIGTTISQGVVSGYLLGVWADLTSAPTAIGASMPTTGFIKFREVTGGTFTSGALSGISASATGADITGWIEIVADAASNHTFPRLGKHTIRGDWFYLSNTDGNIGQVIQIPTNGGGAGTRSPGVWIETSTPDTYEFWPALYGATNGWAKNHLGAAYGETDSRQNFVKDIGSGQIQIGEAVDLSATYANIAAQASTYATLAHSCTYVWSGDIVTVTYATGHLMKTGQQVGLDFTSGDATAYDNIYTITVLDPYRYTVPLSGSGTGGSVTARPGVTVTFTAHTLGVGDTVYCDFTSGTGADGSYTIYGVTSANAYLLSYPHTSALTSGNVSVYSRYQITYTAHGLAVGNRVYLDFTSGSGIDGIYTIVAVATNTFDIIANNSNAADSGNVTIKMTIGNIPPSGRKVRIPNVFLRECATGTRASNQVNGTIGSRPEWAVSNGGYLDFEYSYSTWYYNLAQAYNVKLRYSGILDTLILTEIAAPLDLNDVGIGMNIAGDLRTIQLTSCFAGGTIANVKAQRGNAPGTTDHAVEIIYCKGLQITNLQAGIIQYARSTGKAIALSTSSNIALTNCRGLNSDLPIVTCANITITNYDHCDRYIGYSNSTTGYYAVILSANCIGVDVNGISFGYGGTIPNVHPYNGIFSVTACSNIKLRNAGTFASKLSGGSWRLNAYGCGYAYATGGNNDTIKVQRVYLTDSRTALATTVNSDKNVIFESVYSGMYIESAKAIYLHLDSALNGINKGISPGANSVAANASCYGTHFHDIFMSDVRGRYFITFNEPTAETTTYFTMVSGTAKYNSAGGILMGTIGDQAIWEDPYFRLGHTGFENTTPTMNGGTITNYTIEYDIDLGSGYSNSWTTASGANLSAITIDPSIGFRMKTRITTTSTNTTAITYLRFDTISTASTQQNNLYPLDVIEPTLSITGLADGTEVRIFKASDSTLLAGTESSSGGSFSYKYLYSTDIPIYIMILHMNYEHIKLTSTLGDSNFEIPVQQKIDRWYSNPV